MEILLFRLSPYTGRKYVQGTTDYFGPKKRNEQGEIIKFGGDPLKRDLPPAMAYLLLHPKDGATQDYLSISGSYPLADHSYLLENRSGMWADITHQLTTSLQQAGLVREVHWLEQDQKERPILMVLSAWSDPLFFKWQKDQWKSVDDLVVTDESGREIGESSGWWTSATPLGFDQDGDQDFLLGNMGLNYCYEATSAAPLKMYALDMDQNASLELWLGYYQNGQLLSVKERDDVYQQWRNVKREYLDYASYAEATLPEILGDKIDNALRLRANTLANLIMINEGNMRFCLRVLPDIGQISSLQHAVMMNLNKDGLPELITGGNFYPTERQTPRLDASVGHVYQVNDGKLDPIPMQQSGLFIPGDVRKMSLVRTASDPLLLVANNDGPL